MSIVYKELQSGLDFRLADSTIFAKKQAYYIEFDIQNAPVSLDIVIWVRKIAIFSLILFHPNLIPFSGT